MARSSDESNSSCTDCRLPINHCVCSERPRYAPGLGVCLLYHAAERALTSNTGHLVEECLEPTFGFIWSRTQVPPGLLALLDAPEWAPQLIFPGEYSLSSQPVLRQCFAEGDKKPLLVILDATWSQARKMLRQSPYLHKLPCVSLNPDSPGRYRLRRSRQAGHLCTAEVVEQCLRQWGEPEAANGLGDYLDRYSEAWLAARENLPAPTGRPAGGAE
jgi:DTW domain-containing protein